MMTDSEHRDRTAERAWHEARIALKAAIERALPTRRCSMRPWRKALP